MRKTISLMRFIKTCLSILGLTLLLEQTAQAQNTGGVFPPTVNEGSKVAQYRIAVNPEASNGETEWAQRLHYQQAINDDFMWRILGGTNSTDSSEIEFDFIGAELFWEFSDNEDSYKHGIRFDGQIRNDSSDFVGFNWINQWNLPENWRTRFVVLTGYQTGSSGADGVSVQARTQVVKTLENKLTLGLETYSNFGNTGNFGDFNDQSHSIAPVLGYPVGDGASIFGGPIFGISDGAPDIDLRFWITQKFG